MVKKKTANAALFRKSFGYYTIQNLVTMGYVLLQAKLFSDMVSLAMEYRYTHVLWSALYLIVLTSVYFVMNAMLKIKTDLAKEIEYQRFREKVVESFFKQSRKEFSSFMLEIFRKRLIWMLKKWQSIIVPDCLRLLRICCL